MSTSQATLHLKRAHGILTTLQSELEGFSTHIAREAASISDDAPLVSSLVSSYAGGRRIAAERANFHRDISLAWSEIDKADQIDPAATYAISDDQVFDGRSLRASAHYVAGQIEAIGGSNAKAKESLGYALQIMEHPDYHYMLGYINESEHNAPGALVHYERCLELDPDGEYSVPALRAAERMRNYSKKFRGHWGTFGCLLIVFFPAAFLYYFAQRK